MFRTSDFRFLPSALTPLLKQSRRRPQLMERVISRDSFQRKTQNIDRQVGWHRTLYARIGRDTQPMHTLRFRLAGVLVIGGLVAIVAHAQQNPPIFRAGINLVQVDVSVVDKSGAPVRRLKKEDFVVREDNKPQVVDQLSEVTVPVTPPPTAPWMTTVSTDVATNEFQDRRLLAIVLDDAMMPAWPPAIKNAKAIAKYTVEHMGSNDLAAVIFTRDTTLSQEFTADKPRLLAAIDKLTAGYSYSVDRNPNTGGGSGGGAAQTPPGTKNPNPDEYWYKTSAQILTNVAEDLIAIPQRRKVLVYVGIGVAYDLEAANSGTMGLGGDLEEREMMIGIREKVTHAIESAQAANVAIYSYEPAGQAGIEGFLTSGMAHNVGPSSPPPDKVSPELAAAIAKAHRELVQTLAENTGGRSVINTGDFTPALDRMFKENDSYYLLGYRQDVPQKPGEYRRLDITVNRPDVEVRSRHMNYVSASDVAALPSDAREAMMGLLPNAATPMRVTAMPFALPAGVVKPATATKNAPDAALAIVLGVTDEAPPERRVEHIELVESAFTPDGTPRGTQTQTADVTIHPDDTPVEPGQTRRAAFEVLSIMPIRSGRQQI